jgi:hypothetical protein
MNLNHIGFTTSDDGLHAYGGKQTWRNQAGRPAPTPVHLQLIEGFKEHHKQKKVAVKRKG